MLQAPFEASIGKDMNRRKERKWTKERFLLSSCKSRQGKLKNKGQDKRGDLGKGAHLLPSDRRCQRWANAERHRESKRQISRSLATVHKMTQMTENRDETPERSGPLEECPG